MYIKISASEMHTMHTNATLISVLLSRHIEDRLIHRGNSLHGYGGPIFCH